MPCVVVVKVGKSAGCAECAVAVRQFYGAFLNGGESGRGEGTSDVVLEESWEGEEESVGDALFGLGVEASVEGARLAGVGGEVEIEGQVAADAVLSVEEGFIFGAEQGFHLPRSISNVVLD